MFKGILKIKRVIAIFFVFIAVKLSANNGLNSSCMTLTPGSPAIMQRVYSEYLIHWISNTPRAKSRGIPITFKHMVPFFEKHGLFLESSREMMEWKATSAAVKFIEENYEVIEVERLLRRVSSRITFETSYEDIFRLLFEVKGLDVYLNFSNKKPSQFNDQGQVLVWTPLTGKGFRRQKRYLGSFFEKMTFDQFLKNTKDHFMYVATKRLAGSSKKESYFYKALKRNEISIASLANAYLHFLKHKNEFPFRPYKNGLDYLEATFDVLKFKSVRQPLKVLYQKMQKKKMQMENVNGPHVIEGIFDSDNGRVESYLYVLGVNYFIAVDQQTKLPRTFFYPKGSELDYFKQYMPDFDLLKKRVRMGELVTDEGKIEELHPDLDSYRDYDKYYWPRINVHITDSELD